MTYEPYEKSKNKISKTFNKSKNNSNDLESKNNEVVNPMSRIDDYKRISLVYESDWEDTRITLQPAFEEDWNTRIISYSLSTPPEEPEVEDRYIVADGGTGEWEGWDRKIVEWNGLIWTVIRNPSYTDTQYGGDTVTIGSIFYTYNEDGEWVLDEDEYDIRASVDGDINNYARIQTNLQAKQVNQEHSKAYMSCSVGGTGGEKQGNSRCYMKKEMIGEQYKWSWELEANKITVSTTAFAGIGGLGSRIMSVKSIRNMEVAPNMKLSCSGLWQHEYIGDVDRMMTRLRLSFYFETKSGDKGQSISYTIIEEPYKNLPWFSEIDPPSTPAIRYLNWLEFQEYDIYSHLREAVMYSYDGLDIESEEEQGNWKLDSMSITPYFVIATSAGGTSPAQSCTATGELILDTLEVTGGDKIIFDYDIVSDEINISENLAPNLNVSVLTDMPSNHELISSIYETEENEHLQRKILYIKTGENKYRVRVKGKMFLETDDPKSIQEQDYPKVKLMVNYISPLLNKETKKLEAKEEI